MFNMCPFIAMYTLFISNTSSTIERQIANKEWVQPLDRVEAAEAELICTIVMPNRNIGLHY